jgi:hypothetical protein
LRILGVFIQEKVGSKIALASRKEGNRVGAGQSTETGCGG